MTSILFAILGIAAFLLLAGSLGDRIARALLGQGYSDGEFLLTCTAVGVVAIQLLVVLALLTNHFRAAIVPLLLVACCVGAGRFPEVIRTSGRILTGIWKAQGLEKWFSGLAFLVILIEFLAAMAPLTASDALHYHFTVPEHILRYGYHPDFFLSHSFFCGESHSLILLGLATGGERLALAFLFLGGVLSAAAAACLASRWMSRSWAWVCALLFLGTPLVFWQIASPGAPDLWMSLFAVVAVLSISKAREQASFGPAIVAGILAGGIAGAKYTGCFIAAALFVALLVEVRSVPKVALFSIAALLAGAAPYMRNFVWSGDPFFPFLLSRLAPQSVNATALASYIADTGSGAHNGILGVVRFTLLSAIDPERLGFFQFFGPLVLAFSPLLLRAVRNTPLWRSLLVTWILSAIGISMRSGISRFLVAIFPLAIVAAIACVATLEDRRHRILRLVSVSSIALFLAAGFAGLTIYARNPIKATLGLKSRENYLRERSPDYQANEFVNHFFERRQQSGAVLVFMRHLYYLRVPFLYGDPNASWGTDPSALQTPEQWRAFIAQNGIGWVVRSAEYPAAIPAALASLEKSGELVPVARTEVENFSGNRILGVRQKSELVILQVKLRQAISH